MESITKKEQNNSVLVYQCYYTIVNGKANPTNWFGSQV